MLRKILTIGFVMLFVIFANLSTMANDADVDQDVSVGTSSATDNEATITQDGVDNDIDIDQDAKTSNKTELTQTGNYNKIDIDEDAGTTNYAKVDQTGNTNKVLGTDPTGGTSAPSTVAVGTGPAVQKSTYDYNYLLAKQLGNGNDIGLFQWAVGGSPTGYNRADITQKGNGQDPGGNTLAAWQRAAGNYNDLLVDQEGNNNSAMVIQNAGLYNKAEVLQTGDGNILKSWQNAPTGSNYLKSIQTGGGMNADLHQDAGAGNNVANITQTL